MNKYKCKHCNKENTIELTDEEYENDYDICCDYCEKTMSASEIINN